MTKAYRAAGGLAPKIMLLFFVIGAAIPAIGFLQNLGSTTAGDYLYLAWKNPSNFYADRDVLVALHLSFNMSMGRTVWIQAMLYVALGGGFFFQGFLGLMHTSESRQLRLPRAFKWHSIASFVVALLGFAVFMVDIIKFFFIRAHQAYAMLTVLYMVLFVPVWTMWIGMLLAEVPAEFLKGKVVVKGPAYAELGAVGNVGTADSNSVELEENPRRTATDDNVVDDNVVEINLE